MTIVNTPLTIEEISSLDLTIIGGQIISGSIDKETTEIITPIIPTVNVVCLGDSNTEGIVGIADVNDIYSNLLDVGDGTDDGIDVKNSGIGGNQIPDVIARLQTDLYEKRISGVRNIVTLLIGTNDFKLGKDVNVAWSELQTLIDLIQKDGWELSILTYPPKDNDTTRNIKIREFNTLIKDNGILLGYTPIDLYNEFVDTNNQDINKSNLIQDDGTHFTEDGHTVISEIINLTYDNMFKIGIIAPPPVVAFHTKAINLDGSTEYMSNTTNNSIGLANSWTVDTWAKRVASQDQVLFNIEQTSGDNNRIFCFSKSTTNVIQVQIFDSAGSLFKTYDYAGQMSTSNEQVTITWDGTNLKLFRNSIEDTSPTKVFDDAVTQIDSSRTLNVGVFRGFAPSLHFGGNVSKVNMWNTNLPQNAITSLNDSGNGYQLDIRNSKLNYTQTANVKHQYALGKDDTNESTIGQDFVSSGNINIGTNSANITSADVVTF